MWALCPTDWNIQAEHSNDVRSLESHLVRLFPRGLTQLAPSTETGLSPSRAEQSGKLSFGPWLLFARAGYYSAGAVAIFIWLAHPKQVEIDQLLGIICTLMVFAHVSYLMDRR